MSAEAVLWGLIQQKDFISLQTGPLFVNVPHVHTVCVFGEEMNKQGRDSVRQRKESVL